MCQSETHWIKDIFSQAFLCAAGFPLNQCRALQAWGVWEYPEMGGGITPGQDGCHASQAGSTLGATGLDYGRHGAANISSI